MDFPSDQWKGPGARGAFLRIAAVLLVHTFSPQNPAAELHVPAYAVPLVLRIQDPVVWSMGLSGAAHRSGSLAPLTNPAGLSDSASGELTGVHAPAQDQFLIPENRPQALNQESIAAALPFNRFVLAGQFIHYNLGSESGGPEETSDSRFVRVILMSGAGRIALKPNWALSLGLNLKRIQNRFAHKQGTGYSCDLGCRIRSLRPNRILSAGLSVFNLGPDIRYKLPLDTEHESQMRLIRAGLAGQFIRPFQNIPMDVLAAADYQRTLNHAPSIFQNLEMLAVGVEMRLYSAFFLRFGGLVDLSRDRDPYSVQGFSFGAGLHFDIPFENRPPLHVTADYGRGPDIQSLNRNMISLTLGYDLQQADSNAYLLRGFDLRACPEAVTQ